MKLILRASRVLAFGMFLIAAAASCAAQTKHENQNMDKEAIRMVLASYVETWNRHDMDAWGKLFTDDVDYVNRGGGWPGFKQPSGEESKDLNGIITMVLVKRNDKWLIRVLQNTVTSPPPKPER